MIAVAVIGAGGYVGGELLRILCGHPQVALRAAVSRTFAGRRVDAVHPNLRRVCELAFVGEDELRPCDVVFLAGEHGTSVAHATRAPLVIDLTADFRLRDPAVHARVYPETPRPAELAAMFVPGIAELHRGALREAARISVPGCMATAAILALHPVRQLIADVAIDARTGSSGAGATAEGNLHAERSGALRVFAPLHHRHEAEIAQATGLAARMSATGVEAVRGVQVLCRARAREPVDDRRLWGIYREAYGAEPFVRIVAQKRGAFRYPDPKILAGSNFCDIGFATDGTEVVLIAALDNLVKGSAGAAVQAMNIRLGLDERAGLGFPGLHPIG